MNLDPAIDCFEIEKIIRDQDVISIYRVLSNTVITPFAERPHTADREPDVSRLDRHISQLLAKAFVYEEARNIFISINSHRDRFRPNRL